jgi:hypothetical protein
MQAVTVLDHPISDLGLLLPNGHNNSTASGISIIAINIPKLLYQYRCFMDHRAKLGEVESILCSNHFIHAYVIPNMLYTHTDICILNKLVNLHDGAPMSVALSKHSFPVVDYNHRVDNILRYVITLLSDSKTGYPTYLSNIPSIYKDNMLYSLQMPDIIKNKQVWWALLLSRLKAIKFLLDIGGMNGVSTNRSMVNQLQILLMRLRSESTMAMVFNRDQYYDISSTINEILKL